MASDWSPVPFASVAALEARRKVRFNLGEVDRNHSRARTVFTAKEDFYRLRRVGIPGGELVCVTTTVPPGRISCSPKQGNSARARLPPAQSTFDPVVRSMAPAAASLTRGCTDEASQNGLRHHRPALGTCRRVRRRPVQWAAYRNRNAGPELAQSARCRAAIVPASGCRTCRRPLCWSRCRSPMPSI